VPDWSGWPARRMSIRYRPLGSSELIVSEIGIGCQPLGGGLYHGDAREAVATLRRAFASGINFFDTSDHYGLGRSEILLGRAFHAERDRVVLATKAGTLYSVAGKTLLKLRPLARPIGRVLRPLKLRLDRLRAAQRRCDFSPEYLIGCVEASLRRLRTDYLDLLQLHKPPAELLESGQLVATMETLRTQGKLRYLGIACDTLQDAFLCLDLPGITSIQVTVNLIQQEAIDLLSLAGRNGLGVIARNPRAQGHLTDRLEDITAETYAADRAAFEQSRLNAALFRDLANERRTLAQVALQFVCQLDGVSVAIPRVATRSQLGEVLGSLSAPPLSARELSTIAALWQQSVRPVSRYSYRIARGQGYVNRP